MKFMIDSDGCFLNLGVFLVKNCMLISEGLFFNLGACSCINIPKALP